MSVTRSGVRVSAAAVVLGLSLAGPQAAGTANAAPTSSEESSVSAGSAGSGRAAPANRSTVRERSRSKNSGGSQDPADAKSIPSKDADNGDRRSPLSGIPRGDRDNPGPSNVTNPAPAFVSAASVWAAQSANAHSAAQPRTARSGRGPGAQVPVRLAGMTPVVSPAISTLFDSTANWLSGLPSSPVADFLQGALLLVRRTLFPGSITGPVDPGTSTATAPYLSEQALRDYLLKLAQQQYGGLFGQTVPQYEYGGPWYYDVAYASGGGVAGERGAIASSPIVSGTNNQEQGVDEADFVETDGNMLYVARNGALTIVDRDLNVASQVSLSGNVVGAFLSGDRLTVITQSGYGSWYGPVWRLAGPGSMPYGWGGDPETTVTVFDVADPTTPAIASQTTFDGSFHDARAVDGVVYLVLDTPFDLPELQYTDTPVEPGDIGGETVEGIVGKPAPWSSEIIAYRTYETWDEYVARVGDQIVSLSLPHAYTVDAQGNSVDIGVITTAGNIVGPRSGDLAQSMLTVVSIDSADASAESGFDGSIASMVPAYGSTVYMTTDALYLATTESNYSSTRSSQDTRIDRYTIDGTKLGWQGTGMVEGTLINQFAMDEQDGYLRVATHNSSSVWTLDRQTGGAWSTRNDNGVYVLDTSGASLDEVGRLTGLAPGEQLYAARFIGSKAYLVTFLQTDPLFAIDLSDPTTPTLEGELVIPGFSNYLQPVGDGLLLGIGQERETGSWNTHLHASLFDVSDGTNLTQIERQYLDGGAQWSWSEAQFDHHALLYSAEDGLLVLPMAASGYDSETGVYRYDQLLKVLRVSAEGIEEVGEIVTDAQVIRVVRIDDVLYAVTDSGVTGYRLSDLSMIGTTA